MYLNKLWIFAGLISFLFVVSCEEKIADQPNAGVQPNDLKSKYQVRVIDQKNIGIEGAEIWVSYSSSSKAIKFSSDSKGWVDLELDRIKREKFHSIVAIVGKQKQSKQRGEIQWPLVFKF